MDILDLPQAVNVIGLECVVFRSALTLLMDTITTDATVSNPATYAWNVTGSNGVSYTTTNVANFEDDVTNLTLPLAPFNANQEPVALNLVLDLDDGTCQNQQSWVEVVDVYPNPKVSLATDNDGGNDWQPAAGARRFMDRQCRPVYTASGDGHLECPVE